MLRSEALATRVLDTEALRLAGTPFEPSEDSRLGLGPRLARAWLTEQWRWRRLMANPALAGRLMDLDFDEVLERPAETTARLARHFGFAVPGDGASRIEASGLLERYAKDGSQRFDVGIRARELRAAAEANAEVINEAVTWAERQFAPHTLDDLAERLAPRADIG